MRKLLLGFVLAALGAAAGIVPVLADGGTSGW
jgi:hypothetical protein